MRSNLHRLAGILHGLSNSVLVDRRYRPGRNDRDHRLAGFGRYVLNSSPSWTEPVALILMGWFIFLGAAVGVREDTHLGFDVLLKTVPPGVGQAMRIASDLAVIAFGGGMVYFGTRLAIGTWTATIPVLRLPGGFEYLSIVAGGGLIALFALEKLVRRLGGMAPAYVPVEDDRPEAAAWNS